MDASQFGAGTPSDGGIGELLLALLIAGHIIGDFLLQTRWMAEGKGSPAPLAAHMAMVSVAHCVLLLPFLQPIVVAVVAGVVLLHGAVDLLKAHLSRKLEPTRGLQILVADQVVHLLILCGAWLVLVSRVSSPRWIPDDRISAVTVGVVFVAAYIFNWNGGSVIVRNVLGLVRLDRFDAPDGESGSRSRQLPGTGHIIGVLERFLMLTLVLLGEWGALGLILAAKSIARFKELENREFSEYYLLGTLTSVTVALITGLAVRLVL